MPTATWRIVAQQAHLRAAGKRRTIQNLPDHDKEGHLLRLEIKANAPPPSGPEQAERPVYAYPAHSSARQGDVYGM